MAAEEGALPPGSARAAETVRLPNAREALLEPGAHWSDLEPDKLAS